MILCCGESLIDMLPRQLGDGASAFLPVAGGAVFNSAIALGRLGEKTGFFCGLSTDMFGDLLASTLAQSSVDHSLCPRLDRPTTLAFVTLVNGHAKYAFYDENTALRSLSVADLPANPDIEAALFGAISLIGDGCAAAYEEFARRLSPSAVIALDPNVRPGFVKDAPAYRARLSRMLAMADIIKVSQDDLDWLEPGVSFEKVASGWLAGGASIVVLTSGEEGSTAITRDGTFHGRAYKAQVVDTVGAGDTYNAGFLAGLRRTGVLSKIALRKVGRPAVESAMDLAARAAAVTVSRAGANPPFAAEIGL
jgi:fructokinase